MTEITAAFVKLAGIRALLQSLLDERGGPRVGNLPYLNFSTEDVESCFVSSARQLELLKTRLPQLYADFPVIKTAPTIEMAPQSRESMRYGRDQVQRLARNIDQILHLRPSSERESPVEAATDKLEQLSNRFHVVVKQLRLRYGGRETLAVEDEYDVQDLLHALLLLEFDDVRQEEHTPSYAGGSARMDFLLKEEQVVVEVKCSREGLGSKQIGDQLLIEIGRYRSHPNCKSLFCFVYDPEGRLQNPRGIESDLSGVGHGLPTRVCIRPVM